MITTINPKRLELDDLEWFIGLGGLVGFRQFGFSEIRARQDATLTERLRQRALARIQEHQLTQVTDDSFFLGSVDYMVRDGPDGQVSYTVLETNGGSSRWAGRVKLMKRVVGEYTASASTCRTTMRPNMGASYKSKSSTPTTVISRGERSVGSAMMKTNAISRTTNRQWKACFEHTVLEHRAFLKANVPS